MSWSCRSCWKQGPAIDNQTRQRIWEENYKIRESLRGVQQSEHFWSFQMTRGGCGCSPQQSMHKKFGSLQSLHRVGCSLHCASHSNLNAALPSMCQVHTSAPESPTHHRRDVATETSPPYIDKAVGPDNRLRRVQLAPADDAPSRGLDRDGVKTCSRYKPPDWSRNESNARNYRQQSIHKLRKNEEALQQVMQRKKGPGHGTWGTEYSRSYKEGTWPKALGAAPRLSFQSRAGTPMPRDAAAGARDTPLPRHAGG